jgi:purine nucleosidase
MTIVKSIKELASLLSIKKITMMTVIMTLVTCTAIPKNSKKATFMHHVIFDTDTNNELDDQHALAYLLFNGEVFAVEGVTVNATSGPGFPGMGRHVSGHYEEAKRVMQLCGVFNDIPLLTGANGSFLEIKDKLDSPDFDGHEAVDFIIEQALRNRGQELILLPVGKLTNIALALEKEPAIAKNIRIVWLGSNYPEPGEHNQGFDVPAMNYILDMDVPFEMVTVRYGKQSGTSAVRITQAQVFHRMPGKGPKLSEPVTGRHGGQFYTWGDYSVNLFEKSKMYGDIPARPFFDQAAVAIIKNPDWAEKYEHPAPIFRNGQWIERLDNPRKITIWEWFDIYGIVYDYFLTMDNYVLTKRP